MEFRLYPVRTVYGGNLYYPLERARELLEFYAGWSKTLPDQLTSAATFRSFPAMPGIPESLRGRSFVALRGCFCGENGESGDGAALLEEARAVLGPATVDTFAEMPAATMAGISSDPIDPVPAVNHTELVRDLTPATIDALIELAGPDAHSPLVMLELRQLGGALAGPPGALSAMAHTEARFSLNAIGVAPTPAQTSAVRTHLEAVAARLRAHSTVESYLNFLDLDGASPARVRSAYTTADWHRLVRLKSAIDPHDVFRFNRNISAGTPGPSRSSGG